MRVVVPRQLIVGVRALGIGQPGRGLVRAMAMWQPQDGAAPTGRPAGALVRQDAFWETVQAEGTAFDDGFPKFRGEFLVSGSAFSPTPVTELGVSAALGTLKKMLLVYGERFWSGSRASKPVAFTEMPITRERAMGGPKDHRNMVGRGQIEDEKIGAVMLPNIELPQEPVRGPGDRPPPAGFGPRPSAEVPRRDRLGTMDDAWIDTRFPEMPQNFDPLFGQQAPEDQWAAGPWRGDEAFSLLNLHPTLARWEGRLPGLAARAWVRRTYRPEPEEVRLTLDTVWFFPRAGRVALIWRGLFELDDDDVMNASEVMAALEWSDAPRPAEHYQATRLRRDPKRGTVGEPDDDADLIPPELAPQRAPAAETPAPSAVAQASVLDAMRAELTATLQATQEDLKKQRENLVALGQPTKPIDDAIAATDPETAWQALRAGPPAANAEDDELDASVTEARAALVATGAKADDVAELDLLVVDAKLAEARAEAAVEPVGPPDLPSAEQQLDVLAMLRAVQTELGARYPAEVEAQLAALDDPRFKRDLAAEEDVIREQYRGRAHRQAALVALGPEASAARRAAVERAIAAGEALRRWDLTALDLRGLDFRKADVSEAWLESAVLAGANLSGCNLSRAVLTRADLRDADLRGADLREANLGGADLRGADLGGAKLALAICAGARFEGASLAGTTLKELDLSGATFGRTVFRGCSGTGVVVTGVDLSDCDFQESDLRAGNFSDCRLHRCDFRGVLLGQTLFFACQGDDVNFSGADAVNLRFAKGEGVSSFVRANFRDAKLERACLGDTSLQGADFRGASAPGAIFSNSDLSGARFDGVPLQGAHFDRAILRQASFVAADLMEATLMRARAQGANFAHANLFGVDTLRMRLDAHTQFHKANLEGLRFVQPIREDGTQRS